MCGFNGFAISIFMVVVHFKFDQREQKCSFSNIERNEQNRTTKKCYRFNCIAVFQLKSKSYCSCKICTKIMLIFGKKKSLEKSHFAYRSFFLKVDKFSYPENELWYLLLLQIRFGNGLLPFCHITRYSNKDTTKIYYKYEYLLCAKRGSMKFWKMKLEWNWKNLILIKFLEAIENYQFQIKNWLMIHLLVCWSLNL